MKRKKEKYDKNTKTKLRRESKKNGRTEEIQVFHIGTHTLVQFNSVFFEFL